MNNPIIEVRNVVNRFGDHTVHDGLNLTVFENEIIGIVGGSGTGKSVLLRTIAGLLTPAAGRIEVLGTDIRAGRQEALAGLRRRMGVMFQDGALFSSLTVRENVEGTLTLRESPWDPIKELLPMTGPATAQLHSNQMTGRDIQLAGPLDPEAFWPHMDTISSSRWRLALFSPPNRYPSPGMSLRPGAPALLSFFSFRVRPDSTVTLPSCILAFVTVSESLMIGNPCGV